MRIDNVDKVGAVREPPRAGTGNYRAVREPSCNACRGGHDDYGASLTYLDTTSTRPNLSLP